MPLTLEQYADHLDARKDLPWPAPPVAVPVKARPHLVRLPGVRAVLWNVYGTLLAIPLGELVFEHPQPFIMTNALEKTIQEFKMWGSMSRKPGQPSEYLSQVYAQLLAEMRAVPAGSSERHPEVSAEKLWEAIVKRLIQKEYRFDAALYGALNEFSRKVAYFFHASLQGTACYEGAADALRHVARAGLEQGLLGDGQCFTPVQLGRGLRAQGGGPVPGLCFLSHEYRGRKPSERLFRKTMEALQARGIAPAEVLHVGSRIAQDLAPARRAGMRTALFAGDKTSLQATAEQLKDPATKPDVLLTELSQIAEVVG
ncbi:MAG: HAD family hydrolase [Gemmataceae bacterium]|nr:HAD family hydrolase [Gemmataceae bacterium]